MEEKFLVGVILGMLSGALVVTNSVKARQAVSNSQQQVIDKLDNLGKNSKLKKSK